ncbi:MAG: DegV family protein [Clostridia bacterium]|nr:DegV family protein [Clostridia bacterium]
MSDFVKDFEISTDSTCDLYADEISAKGLYFLPLTFTLTTKSGEITEYKDEFKSPEEYRAYYDKLRAGILSRTSMNNPFVHEEHFRAMAKSGVKRAIHFTISYGLCRTVDVAREAVKEIQKEYPDFNCLCVECSTTTIGQGYLVNLAVEMRDSGKTLEETFEFIENNKKKIQHFVIADSLMYLMRGGRISATSAVVGTALNIKPIIVFNKEGKLVNYKKGHGMKKSISQIVGELSNYTLNENSKKVVIGHSDNLEMATVLHDKLLSEHGIDAEIRMIGPVIGSHLGPNAVAYIFMSNEERPL